MHPFCAIFNGSCEIFFMGLIMPEIPETDPVPTGTPTGNPPTGTPSPTPTSTKPDQPGPEEPSLLQKGAKALAKGAKKNVSDAVDKVDEEITEEDKKKKKPEDEQDKGFAASILSMIKGMAQSAMEFREELIKVAKPAAQELAGKAKDKLGDIKDNKDVKEGLDGLKQVATDVLSMAKGMMSSGPKPKSKGKDNEEEEGIEMTDMGADKDEEASEEDDVQLSSPPSSPSLKEIASQVFNSLYKIAQGFGNALSSSSDATDKATKTAEVSNDDDKPKMNM